MPIVKIPYRPRSAFLPLHNRKQRFAVTVAHRRAGKTVAEINDKIKAALMCPLPNPRVAYIAPLLKQAKSVAWQYLKHYGLVVPGSTANESELHVTFPNGGQVRLYGADNPDALRGIYLDDVTMDEVADMNPRLFPEIIRPTLVDRKGQASFIGTAKGRNHFYDLVQHAKQNPTDYLLTILKASETKLIATSELKALRRQLTEDQYNQEFECSFDAALIGAYYGKDMNDNEEKHTDVPYDRSLKVHLVFDLGYKDDTAIWFYQVVRGEVHVIDFYDTTGSKISEIAAYIKSLPYNGNYGDFWLPPDAVAKTLSADGVTIQEKMADHFGWENVRIVPDIGFQDGIDCARMLLRNCWFNLSTTYAGTEMLRQYQKSFDEARKVFRLTHKHDFTSHAADAFRYLGVVWKREYGGSSVQEVDISTDTWGRLLSPGESWKVS